MTETRLDNTVDYRAKWREEVDRNMELRQALRKASEHLHAACEVLDTAIEPKRGKTTRVEGRM